MKLSLARSISTLPLSTGYLKRCLLYLRAARSSDIG